MSDVLKEIGEFAYSNFGQIVTTVTGTVGMILLATPLAPVGVALIITSMVLSISAGIYAEELAQKKLKSPTGHLINTRTSQTPLPVVYGTCRVGGNIIFIHTEGANNNTLYMVLALCEAPIKIGNEVVILNEDPVFRYTKKTNSQWIIKMKLRAINRIRIKVTLEKKSYLQSANNFQWYKEEFSREISEGSSSTYTVKYYDENNTLQTTSVTVQYTSNDNILVTVQDSNIVRLIDCVIYQYSEDNGQTWENKGQYAGYFDYYIESGITGWDKGNAQIRNYIINNLGFKKPAYTSLLYAKFIWKEGKWQGVPNITVILEGKADVYDPRDGLNKFTNNPALIVLDFLTNKRYGFGIDLNRIDIDSFIEGVNYCDDMGFVYDGILTDGRGLDLLNHILQHFRGYITYKQGKFYLGIKDLNFETPVAIINEEDIIEGTFTLNLPEISEIPNVVKVNYINSEDNYKVDSLIIENVELSAKEDRRVAEVNLYGANTQQAHNLGIYYLERMRLNHTVSFVVSPEFFNLEIGDIIYLNYQSYGIENQLFRIIKITPTPEGFCSITAIIEDERLYNYTVDNILYNIDLTNIPDPTEAVQISTVVLEEVLKKDKDGKLKNWLKISFNDDISFVETYEIWLRNEDDTTFTLWGSVTSSPVMIPDLVSPKKWHVKVVPVTIYGNKDVDNAPVYTIDLLGKLLPPPDVTWANASFVGDRVQIEWEPVEDLDLDGYEIRMGDTWDTGVIVATRHKSNKLMINIAKSGTYKFWIKAIDTVGNYSANPADCEIIVSGMIGRNIYESFDIDFRQGIHNYTFGYEDLFPSGNMSLVSYHGRTWQNMMNTENFTIWNDWINVYKTWIEPIPNQASYESTVYTLPDVLSGRIYADIHYTYIGSNISWEDIGSGTDTWETLGDPTWSWLSFLSIGTFTSELLYSTDGVNWNSFTATVGDVQAKYLKLKLNIINNTETQTFKFTDAIIYFDMPDKFESGTYNITSGTERIYFNEDFINIKGIALTSGTDGKYPILIDYTNTYMDVKMSDNGSGEIHYIINGY